ncbi:imidazolonepropionase [Dactylosporangium sp. NPDC000244]|uniref:imidazolonepropionase n=1 Tax=Dactylosporangium sp. NPDC000244 TaxID=3154365 RepID=UPI00332AC741
MRSLLVTNIGELVTGDPSWGEGPLGIRRDAALVIDGRRVEWIGRAGDTPAADMRLDANGAAVLPGFVDSHSHLVFGGDRAAEFAARMAGQPYTGGGIRTTVGATRAADDEQLRANVARLRHEALRQGTTTMEIKSGYGLSVADESRSLRIAREFSTETTFLGAHVVPAEYAGRADDYVSLVCGPMLTAAHGAGARWIDVFCERGAFDADHSRAILTVGADAGMGVRVHANQLSEGPGVRLAVELNAASADHCTHLAAADIAALAGSSTVATLLPGAEFSTRSPYPPARALLDAGATVALATDCNPGSSYTTSMPFCIALAVREMAMTPAEAVLAATRGGAAALRREDIGRLTYGARGDLVVLDAPSYVHLAYRPGVPLTTNVVLNGELV